MRVRKEAAKDGRIDVLALLAKHGANLDETLPVDVGLLVRDQRYQHASETLHIAVWYNRVASAWC